MTQLPLTLNLSDPNLSSKDKEILQTALDDRSQAGNFIAQEKYLEAMERTVAALRDMLEFHDYQNPEFRMLLVALLFDLAEIHYTLKNYKQSEKEVDTLFKVLDNLVKTDEERFSQYHILAMELSTRILRSRKKALDLLVKQQITTGHLYEKVNAGVAAASDKLIDSLCTTARLLAATGDIREALKFFAEAIKLSKKRAGKVTPKEVSMSVDMAETMMRLRSMKPRAKRLLETILPYAQSLKLPEMQDNINSLIEIIDSNEEPESKWRLFLHKVISGAKSITKLSTHN